MDEQKLKKIGTYSAWIVMLVFGIPYLLVAGIAIIFLILTSFKGTYLLEGIFIIIIIHLAIILAINIPLLLLSKKITNRVTSVKKNIIIFLLILSYLQPLGLLLIIFLLKSSFV